MHFLPMWVLFTFYTLNIGCLMKIFEVASVCNNVFYFSVLEHIKANRRNIEVELKELLKLCGWAHSESLVSIENSKRTQHKLKKLIQKYTVSNMNSSCFLYYFVCWSVEMRFYQIYLKQYIIILWSSWTCNSRPGILTGLIPSHIRLCIVWMILLTYLLACQVQCMRIPH